jgi:hypothetical protein
MQLPEYIRHVTTGQVLKVFDARPIGNALFYECETVAGDNVIVAKSCARPATDVDWNRATQ